MARVQIIRMDAGEKRWSFVAHGAAYEREEAEIMVDRIKGKGGRARVLPLPKGA